MAVALVLGAALILLIATARAAAAVPTTRAAELKVVSEFPGTSGPEAQERLEIQHQAAKVDVVGQLSEDLADQYGGLWFDSNSNEFVVPLATMSEPAQASEDSQRLVQNTFDSAALAGDFRTEVVAFSQEELEQAQDEANEALAQFLEAGQAQTALNQKTNALILRTPEDLPGLIEGEIEAALQSAHIQVPVESEEYASASNEASRCLDESRQCGFPVRGGEEIFAMLGPNLGEYAGEACTAAFRANGNDGRKYILTAGHCHEGEHGEEIWNWSGGGPEGPHMIGTSSQWHWPGRDWMKIDATGTWADQAPWPTEVAYWGVTDEQPITGEANPYVGETLCHSGVNTGTSCGEVVASNVSVHYVGPVKPADLNSMFLAKGPKLCLGAGDSGGPFYAGQTALGILSGGGPDGCGPVEEVFFSSVVAADEELGTNITGPGAPEAVTGNASNVQRWQADLSGSYNPRGLPGYYRFEIKAPAQNYTTFTEWKGTGAGQGFTPVTQTATNLFAMENYTYRMEVQNGLNTAWGKEGSFTTPASPPHILDEHRATDISSGLARLGADIDPEGLPTTYRFEWSPVGAEPHWRVLFGEEPSLGGGRETVSVYATFRQEPGVPKIEPGGTYEYRVTATNSAGSDVGVPVVFTLVDLRPTNTTPPTVLPLEARVGVQEHVTTGSWTPEPTSFEYQWYRCPNRYRLNCSGVGSNIPYYVPRAEDHGRFLFAVVTARNMYGSHTAESNVTHPVE